jgi:MYXO-CTERM domain-containing protein
MLRSMWLLLAGCVVEGRDDWEILPISRAWFEEFDKSSFALVGGVMGGDAVLAWDGAYGPGAMPVHLGGGTLGLAFEFMGDIEGHEGVVPIDLSRVNDPTVADVLGTYKGTGAAAGVIIGGATGRARNGRGASFNEGHFAIGMGVWAGFEWIIVRPSTGEELLTTTTYIDTGSPWTTPFPTDTGTAYTTPGTTPGTTPSDDTSADTGSAPSDGGSSGGCGSEDKEDEPPSTSGSGSSEQTTASTTSTVRACDQTGGSRLWAMGALAALVAARRRRSGRG